MSYPPYISPPQTASQPVVTYADPSQSAQYYPGQPAYVDEASNAAYYQGHQQQPMAQPQQPSFGQGPYGQQPAISPSYAQQQPYYGQPQQYPTQAQQQYGGQYYQDASFQQQKQQAAAPFSQPIYQQQSQPVTPATTDANAVHDFARCEIHPNIDPAYMRCTVNRIPRTPALLSKSRVPFGLTICPYPNGVAEPVPLINNTIVRCRRCRTYLNPFIEQRDQGARWICNLCYIVNDFPNNFDYDPASQMPLDRNARPELTSMVYEFIAPMEYMVRAPQPACYLFLIDVSFAAVSSGMVRTASQVIADSIDRIPDADGRSKIAIITFDSELHFYSLNAAENDVEMLVVSEPDDTFVPLPENLLVTISEHREIIRSMLQRLPQFFEKTQRASPALSAALNAGTKLLMNSGGKAIALLSSLPNSAAEGGLKNREDPSLLGTPKESTLLRTENHYYKLFSSDTTRSQICVDLFLFPAQYIDVASLSCLTTYTGGKLFYYPGFNANKTEDAVKFGGDMAHFLSLEFGLEAVIRVRASQGVNLASYYGSFFLRSTDLLALPNVNPEHSYSAICTIDDKIIGQTACFQAAVLHTTCHGERRIRVLNLCVGVTDDLKELLGAIDQGSLINVLSKMTVEKAINSRLEDARDALVNKCIDILGVFATATGTKQMPQIHASSNLRSLPILTLAMLKSPAFRGGNVTPIDYRAYLLTLIKTMSIDDLVYLVHPYFTALHAITEIHGVPNEHTGEIELPPALLLSAEMIETQGIYLLDNGQDMFLWLGSNAHPELVESFFGKSMHHIESGKLSIPQLDNPWSLRLTNIIGKLREKHSSRHPFTYLIREDSTDGTIKGLFLSQLIADRGVDGQPAYAQWLGFLHGKIQSGSF